MISLIVLIYNYFWLITNPNERGDPEVPEQLDIS